MAHHLRGCFLPEKTNILFPAFACNSVPVRKYLFAQAESLLEPVLNFFQMENKQGELGRSWYHPDYCYLTYVYNRETPEPLQDSRQIPHGNPQMMAPPPVQSYPMMPPVYPPPGQPRFPAPYQPHQPTTRFGLQPQFSFQNPVQQWTSPIPPRQWYVCGFCLNAGHVLRDKFGVRCPLLRRIVCPNCGATGDNAHTLKFCPWTRNNVGGNEGSNNNGDPGVSADEASRFNTK